LPLIIKTQSIYAEFFVKYNKKIKKYHSGLIWIGEEIIFTIIEFSGSSTINILVINIIKSIMNKFKKSFEANKKEKLNLKEKTFLVGWSSRSIEM